MVGVCPTEYELFKRCVIRGKMTGSWMSFMVTLKIKLKYFHFLSQMYVCRVLRRDVTHRCRKAVER